MVTAQPLTDVETALAQRGPGRMVPGLGRIRELLDALGNPHRAFPSIHVAGTNGKTSTSRMIESLLRAHGLHTGRHTSPHLDSVTERIALDGEPITPAALRAVYVQVLPCVELLEGAVRNAAVRVPAPGGDTSKGDASTGDPGELVTYFEFVTALAFAAFADAPVDVAVVEVGLGGTWDATNVIDAGVAVITPIGLDHQAFLGDTVAAIAAEKAGIIADGSLVICAAQPVDAAASLLSKAVKAKATVAREGVEFGVGDRSLAVGGQQITLHGLGGTYPDIYLPLHGAHQAQNAAVALASVEAFFGAGTDKPLAAELVAQAFAQVSSPGRLERVCAAPAILVDAAHNPHGLRATLGAVAEAFNFRRLVVVLSIPADKDARGMLELLEPVAAHIIVTQNSSPRSMRAEELGELAVEVFDPARVEVAPRLDDALAAAARIAEEGEPGSGGVLVTGSVVTAADARRLLR